MRLTFDPNTAYKELLLSNGNRRVVRKRGGHFYPDHPERFDGFCQVLCLSFGDERIVSYSFNLIVVSCGWVIYFCFTLALHKLFYNRIIEVWNFLFHFSRWKILFNCIILEFIWFVPGLVCWGFEWLPALLGSGLEWRVLHWRHLQKHQPQRQELTLPPRLQQPILEPSVFRLWIFGLAQQDG